MEKHLGTCGLAVVCVLLFCPLSSVQARGIKHRFKWSRKVPPSPRQVTEARVAEHRPGSFIRQGHKLDIDFGAEGNRYYEAYYWQLPDDVYYEGCSEANVTREALVASCINATQAENQAEFSQERQDKELHQRVLWQLIKELCSLKHCEFWQERGIGFRVAVDQSVTLGLLGLIWLLLI
ncbi:prion-like protein doppel [Ctenodactylus gundi]